MQSVSDCTQGSFNALSFRSGVQRVCTIRKVTNIFMYCLFNSDVNKSGYNKTSNDLMIVSLNWKWRERKWSWPDFRALFRLLPGEIKEHYEVLTLDSRCPARHSKQEPSKCKSGAVPLEPAYLLLLF
jgi:hypothetical protein